MTEIEVDAVVVGAGVIGLAVARALARAGLEVVVIEAERAVGQHQSSRNSEVIHAGLYYAPGSLKARLCVRGREALYAYCRARDVPHRRIGKLVVATAPHDLAVLQRILVNARANGVDDVVIIDRAEARALEPALDVLAALVSPSTGIIDSHALLRALVHDAESAGTAIAYGSAVTAIRIDAASRFVVTAGDASVRCRRLVNAAGLGAQRLAHAIEGVPASTIPRRYLAKGTYARIAGRPFTRLVYPVPDTASLGIHATIDLDGGVRFGPDQQWVDEVDYALDPTRVAAFYPAIRRFWPALPDDALAPDYTGVRAKVQAPGDPPADFVIAGPCDHGVHGLVHLFGIESPGLTACLAIASEVAHHLAIDAPLGA